MTRNVIVFGATGKTGIQICEQLSSKEIASSAFVREGSSSKLNVNNIRIIPGDVLNKKDVEDTFCKETFSDIIITLGSKALRGADIRSKGTEHIIEAMKLHNCKGKIHVISALGVGDSWDQLKWHAKLLSNMLLKSVMNDHEKQEELVKSSSYEYHILRPVGLKDGTSVEEIHVQPKGFLPQNYITRSGLAKYLVESMVENINGISAICQKIK